MNQRFQLMVGARFMADGQHHVITAIRDGLLETRDAQGVITLTHPSAFLSKPDFKSLSETVAGVSKPTPAIDEKALEKARQLERHIREVMTGSQSPYGDEKPLPPRAEYDPEDTNLSLRVSLKAQELGITEMSIWNFKRRYKAQGIFGLVDQRDLRNVTAFDRIDSRVKDAVYKVLVAAKSESHLTKMILRERIERLVRQEHGIVVKIPSIATMNRYINMVESPLGVFKTANQRKSESNRPNRTFGSFQANRPGQVVMVDSTRLNTFALDPISLKWVQVELTIALDLYSRSIVAWRLTPTVPSVDAALLLYGTLSPKAASASWYEAIRGFYFGIPDEMVFSLPEDEEAKKETGNKEEIKKTEVATIPAVYPETMLVDHGRVFVSEAFRQACLILGISIQYARKRDPTDKSPDETTFDFIKENFCSTLPGFTGANIASRGLEIEKKAVFFISEIEELFAEWVATKWQMRVHEGLFLPGSPKLEVSPNDAYREGIARTGFVYTVPNATLYYELLPCAWRVVNDTGISLGGLFYDHEQLKEYRNVASEYGGKESGKYPIRYDQRNLAEVFFFDYRATPPQWIALRWRGFRSILVPFNDLALAFAKNLCIERELDPKIPWVLEAAMKYLLDRWDQQKFSTEKERRAMAKRAENAVAVTRDRNRMNTILLAPDEEVDLDKIDNLYDPETLNTYMEQAQSQPLGDDYESTFDF